MTQITTGWREWLTPPATAETIAEQKLATLATTHRFTWLDGLLVGNVALTITLDLIAAQMAAGWWTAGAITIVNCTFLLSAVVIARARGNAADQFLGRLLLAGLVAGFCELFTDASGSYFALSLSYPTNEPMLWASPLYMPFSWMVVLTQLGYLGWRLRGLLSWRVAVPLAGIIGAINIPFYEEIAYHARWWHYTPVRTLGHTPAYVLLFEGLLVAILPIVLDRIERHGWGEVALAGVAIGVWMPFAALASWLALGR